MELVVVHGPPSPALSLVLKERLPADDKHVLVYPQQLFEDHPSFGVRDVANHVLSLLKKNKAVVVEDSCAGGGIKECLLKVVPSKLPSCTLCVLELRPQYGQQQALWDRQILMASSCLSCRLLSEESLLRWFDEKGQMLSTSPALPKRCTKESVLVNLTAVSDYKLEVAALLVQWESVVDSGGFLQPAITKVCQTWTQANPCGRVLMLCDGNSVAKGQVTALQEKSRIINCVSAMAKELPVPVYVLQLTSTLEAGEFCLPPSPGLLAFLLQRHHLDLHQQRTVYIYSDARHRKMCENAGVRHIKVVDVLKNPHMILNCHNATVSPIPEMLRKIQISPDVTSGDGNETAAPPSIPLVNRLEDFADHHISVSHPRGHREFVFAKDVQVLQSFQVQYADNATKVGESGSKISTLAKSQPGALRDAVKRTTSYQHVSGSSSVRQIPKWMLGKRESSDARPHAATLEKVSSTSSVEGHGRSRQTIYVMTEKELFETAQEILKEAGKEDLIPPVKVQPTSEATKSVTPRKRSVYQATDGEGVSKLPDYEPSCHNDSPDTALTERKKSRTVPDQDNLEKDGAQCEDSPRKRVTRQQQDGTATEKDGKLTGQRFTPKKDRKQRPSPDLSILDDIFS